MEPGFELELELKLELALGMGLGCPLEEHETSEKPVRTAFGCLVA